MALFTSADAIAASANVDASFIPELWSDEVVASYKKNLVFANLVRKLNHRGKKGDTIFIPRPTRGTATRRADLTVGYDVVPIAYAQDAASINVSIDRHTEYSRLFDDFAMVQSLESLRRFFVDDAGYAISQAIDTDLINEMLTVAFTTNLIFSGGGVSGQIESNLSALEANIAIDGAGVLVPVEATSYAAITDAGVRAAVRMLDLTDVPMANRVWAIRPETKEDLIGLPRFTEQAFVGEVSASNTIRNGLVGDTYGVEVYVTNQLPTYESSANDDEDAGMVSLMFHQDAEVLVEQMGIRTQRDYRQEYLADLLTSDTIYGVKNLREESIITIFAL